jgi:hypothetical protein
MCNCIKESFSWLKLPALIAVLLFPMNMLSVTRYSTGSGNWATAATWSPSGVPACGDSVVILATHVVSITSQQNYNSCSSRISVSVLGTLYFQGGSKLRLPCNSNIYIFQGGQVTSDGSGSSNQIEICGTDYWDGSMGPISGPACIPSGGCGLFLSVELADFRAGPCGEAAVCLEWATLSETNFSHFDLQRTESGQSFVTVASVPSRAEGGTSHYRIVYAATDPSPPPGLSYYRVKSVDLDGQYELSPLLAVSGSSDLSRPVFGITHDEKGLFLKVSGVKNGSHVQYRVTVLLGQELVRGSFDYEGSTLNPIGQISAEHGNTLLIVTVECAGSVYHVKGRD